MKNVTTVLLTSVLALTLFVSQAHAETIDTIIKGTVKNGSGIISGASVTITCNGNVRNTTTNSSGDYLVTYPTSQCIQGNTANGFATSPQGAGSNSAVVQHFTFGPGLELDIAILNITAVPELGFITGIVSAVGSSLMFLGLRRKFA